MNKKPISVQQALLQAHLGGKAPRTATQKRRTFGPKDLERIVRVFASKDLAGAENLAKSYLKYFPDIPPLSNVMGVIQIEKGKNDEALKWLDKAVKADPDFSEAHNNRGNVLSNFGRDAEAKEAFLKAVELNPTLVGALTNLGALSRKENGDIQTAQEYYEKALAVNPNHVTALAGLGYCRKAMGDFETAKILYEKAVALAPDIPANQRSLAQLKKFKLGDPQIEQMEGLLARENNGIEEQISLNFAMAKIYEDVGEVQKSFDCLLEGNRLRKRSLDYNLSRDKQVIEKARRRLSKAKLTPLDVNLEGPTPIFIVGMPRSGTTLTEQIIASHSKVHGAGELRDLNRLAMTFMKSDPLEQEAALLDVRRGYLDSIRKLSNGAKYVTDKMPLNFRWVGLMRAAFPEAKIIHTNRDPMAVCWSIFQRNFTGRGNGYAYNIDDLANFYHLYQDLMAFWDEDMPGQMYQLDYKKLTENQEAESRALVEYCGLDWEDACLEFYKTKRAVLTASSTQVRQKMYTGSTEAWKKFETQLEPLKKALAV